MLAQLKPSSDITTVAHAISREGFEELMIEDVGELTANKALNEEKVLDFNIEDHINSKESSNEERGPMTVNTSLEDLQLSNKLGNYFLSNDHNVQKAVKFQSDLTVCMARYQESYKELAKNNHGDE